eukprot:7317127-Heterocapsa_arctica.AAC.1
MVIGAQVKYVAGWNDQRGKTMITRFVSAAPTYGDKGEGMDDDKGSDYGDSNLCGGKVGFYRKGGGHDRSGA